MGMIILEPDKHSQHPTALNLDFVNLVNSNPLAHLLVPPRIRRETGQESGQNVYQ